MKALLALLLALTFATPAAAQRQYLVSIVDLPLKPGEGLMRFAIDTWAVQVEAVCHIPLGWRLTAGTDATPDGELSGSGSHGATWFNAVNPRELRGLFLVTLYMPVLREDHGTAPATFKGEALISTEDGERTAPLGADNIELTEATTCPSR